MTHLIDAWVAGIEIRGYREMVRMSDESKTKALNRIPRHCGAVSQA